MHVQRLYATNDRRHVQLAAVRMTAEGLTSTLYR
jgi:hypothetical protein